MLIRRIARPLLATTFVVGGIDALRNPQGRASAAAPLVAKGEETLPSEVTAKVPTDPVTLVRINGAVQVGSGVLLAFGKAPRLASLALAATVLPTTVTEQDFWNESDPQTKVTKRTEFLKNLSLLGGVMIAAVDTEGKPSLGWRGRRAARRASGKVSAALPIGAAAGASTAVQLRHGAHLAAERGKEVAEVAAERGSDIAELARDHGPDLAAAARERGTELASIARKRGAELAEIAKERGPELAESARDSKLAELARERGAELAEAAQKRGSKLADAAEKRGSKLADAAEKRGNKLADAAEKRGSKLVVAARDRGSELADTAQHRAAKLRS
ncbi:DoxX family membrane protein [Aldersonia sp. NBC_00410]|uniref:DoxX family membrane protein n=1 Tax=Aldersonia sp. NBC_00410 TaxID=2975954 RepID=UPI002250AC00|nr:DoxX family membrane protein [Aldersonia sp. NBC_00410]MCX5046483.1 DoxX family membrane protein [Aldersonia sp. NBC_00410]